MPKFLNLISQSGKQEFVDVSEFNKNPNAYGKYKIRMVDDSTGKNYDIPATMFGEAQKDGLRAWNMEKQTTKQKQVESPALQTSMSSDNLPADWGNAEMVNPKGLQTFGAPRQLSASEVKAKNNIQAALDALNRRKADGSNQDRDERQLNAQKRVRSAQKQMQDQLDYASYTGQPLVDEFNVKNQQEIDIFTPTGNEGKGFSMLNFGVAPTVARDENNLPLLNDQGMPIKGMEADNVRAAYQRQVEQDARLRELGLHDKTIEEKIYDAKKRAAELEKKLKGGLGTQLYQGRFGNVDTERKDIRLELNNLEQEIRSLEAIRDKDDLALGGFFRSLSNTAFNPKTWDFGVSDLAAMGKMEEINSKLNRKEALTNEEISFANSQIGANSAMALEDEQMGNVYRYTKIGGESLPYMLDFILTGGYSGITKWGARQGLNAAAKFFTTRLGKAIAEKGGRNIAAATLKNTGVLIGDLASSYAMATSIQAGKTTTDILKRHQGDLYVDENGDFKFEGGESMLSATARGINAAMTENLTEKFGTHLPNINVSKMFAKAGLGNASRFLNNMTSKDWYKMVTKMSNRAGIQGYPGEVVEEYLNIPLNAVIVGDNSMSDLIDPQTHGDILGGMALSIGMMGAVGLGGHLVNKSARRLRYNMLNSQLNKADTAASMSFGDNWEGDLKDAIDNTDNANMGAMIGFINNHPDLSEQQRKDALMYIDRLIKVRGFNLGLNAQMKDDTTPPIPYRNVVTNINAQSGVEPFAVISYDENGNLIERKKFMSEERANAYKENLDLQRMDNEAKNIYSSIFVKDTDGSLRQQMNDMLSNIGITLDDIKPILRKNPLKRTEDEQFAIDQMVQFASQLVYPENEVHEEKDAQDGADLAEGTPVGDQATIDVVNEREANAISQWNQVADPDLQSSIKNLYEQGKTSNDIFDWLVANEYSDEVIAAFAELCNSGAQKDKFIEVTGQKIEEQVNQKVQQVTFAGTLNGSKSPAVIQVQDQTEVPMYVVSGDISIIPTDAGSVIQSDGLIVLRDEQGNFIQRPDTQSLTLAGAYNADDYRNQLLAQTQEAVTAQIQATEYKTPEYNDSDMESQAPEAQQGNGLTAPQPANTNEQQEPQQEQEPAIPTDEDGNLLYHKAPIEATINDLYNGTLDDEEIMDFVQNNINESSKEYDKINKKKPKIGTDKNAYLKAKGAWQSQVDEAKQKLDYWSSVQNYIQQQTHTTPEEIKAAQDELSGTTARLEYARQTPEGATTPEQIAGEFVKNAKIQPEDFYRETGLTATDARNQYPGMLSNDGATIARLAEQLVQYDNDNYGGMFFKGDDMEARNYIIEALKNASSRKSLGRDMTAEEQEYARVREQQREDFYQEAYGMSYSDYLAFEEQEMPNIWRRISNFAPEQYDQMVAEYYESLPEDYFTPQNEQQNGTERQQDNGLADSTTILPQPPTDNEAGSGQREDPAAETGTGSEDDNQNEEVPGGTQEELKKNSASDNTTDTDETVNNGKLNDTATQQDTVSEGKDTTKSPNSQENQQKTDKKSDEGQKKDEIAAEIKKDIEDFIAKSTHDVQITNYDEKEFEAQISVDGKPSNIVITPPMELGEAMHAEYRPTEGGYQELGDLLDEYNKGLEPKEQGFDGEHLAAIFSSVDAAINFETWLNQKNNPNDWENLTEEQKAAAIDADTIADENAKELAKDFLRGDNTSTIAEVFYREIVGRYMANEEAPKKKEENKKDNPLNDSIKDIKVVDAPFPKDIAEDSILSKKHNKSGKRDSTYSATIGIKGNDLYVKTNNLKTSEFVVKDALSYNANLIALRLEYAGITTDEARLLGDMVLELYNQKGLAISTAPTLKPLFPQKPKPSNVPPVGQAESDKPNAKPREDKPKTQTPPETDGKSDVGKALDEFKDVMARFRKAGRTDANVSLIGLNTRQIEMLGEVFRATAKLGYALIKSGTTTFENWLEAMKAQVSDIIKANSNWNDQDITDLLTETWNNKYLVDGERKPLSQWAAEEALATEQKQEEQKQEEEQPAETPETPAAEKRFPFTKQQLEGMTKQQMIDAMWHEVFPRVCEMYKLPSDILDENAYWFAPRMTTGYDKDSLVSACMKYMEHLYDEVQPATEKQMNYIMKLAAENEKKLFKDITLTRTAASRVIDLLKSEEEMIYSRSTKQDDFEEVYNELEKIARLNGANIPEARSRANEIAFVDNVIRALENALETGEKPYASITALRKAAREAGMEVGENGETDIKLQELVEDALVRVARKAVHKAHSKNMWKGDKSLFTKDIFETVKLLYNLQPTISMRSSNRVALQQYSTPLPMAFVADMFATGARPSLNFIALEPTAGNGMLVFGIGPEHVHANEIDENRLENLRMQGYFDVTSQDATLPFNVNREYNAIITNPPFGSTEAKDYDGYKIAGLAQQIALNALDKMKDKGKAVIIIGGKQEFAPNGAIKNDKPFLTYLYNHYNVKGVIDMEGSLYAKQGTTFPTRMILIDRRRTEEERAKSDVYPPTIKDWLPKADSFDKLYDTVKSLMESKEKTNGTEIVHAKDESLQPDRGVTLPGNTDKGTDSRKPVQDVATTGRGHGPNRGNGKDSKRDNPELDLFGGVLGGSGELSDKPANESGTGGGSGRRTGRDNGPAGEGVDNRLPVVNDVPGVQGTTTRGVGLDEEKRSLESDKLSYRPHNGAFSLESVAPAAMVEAMDKTLKRIEEEFDNIDEFVTNELGYDSIDAMHKALAAEQVDSVAMAIYNMKKGEALIIGDQTGVGKGRQMAALIRWARRQGKKPIFMTQKANLFNDIYRDLKDIGSGNLKPFIFNQSESNITEITEDENGNEKVKVIYKRATDKEIADALKYGKIPDDCDFVLCTYSQVSTGDSVSREYEDELNKQQGDDSKKRSRSRKPKPGAKPRKDTKAVLLRALAKDNYLMLDESHTAAGESNQGFYMQTLVRDSKAVTFASATYAKRPDTMPLYALRTAMSKANIGMRNLIAAIQKGGVTLQEIMSRALSDSGQMVRRERDMTGVVTDWMTIDDPETVKRARENYDRTIQAFNAIIDFQNVYVEAFLNGQRASLAVRAGNADYVRGTDKMGISNTPFANKTYNYTKQLMLALKVDAIVDEVDRQIKAGRRPVIALDNTMGSMLDDLTVGEEVEETTFAASLIKGLQSIMQYMQDDGMGNKVRIRINPSELGAEGEAAYYQLISFIKESTKGVFISPLDEITNKLRAKGYKVGELTGRDKIVTEENGKYYVAKKGKVSKQLIQSRFNSNALDVLILNKTASTGISLHASKTFADQRQRVMILAQPLPDINDYMQMIGRIDRTGQVKRGYYINLGLPVPAEQRFLMMLSTKLKSLNANTTTSQESKDNKVEAPDMLNKYGSQVIVEYFKDHPDVYNKLNDPLNVASTEGGLSEYTPAPDDSAARKLTGYVALLSTDEQQAFYDDVVERYNTLIKYLDDTGTNDLKITSLPLGATTLARSVSSEGNDPTGDNPFAQNAYVEMVEMNVLRKPMKTSEINTAINNIAKGKDPKQAVEDIKNKYEDEYNQKLDKQERKYQAELERNKETLKKFEDKINSNEKMSEEDKKKAIEEKERALQEEANRKNDNAIGALEFDHERMVRDLDLFKVGSPYLIPDNLDALAFDLASPGIFIGFKAKENGITPSSTLAVFATLDGRRRVEVKLSERGRLNNINETTNQNYDAAQEVNLSNWDSNIPNITRKTGYIMTGNILQAINDSQDENGNFTGQLISFTDSEDNVRDGILMPDKWEPTMLVNAGRPIASAKADIESGKFVRSMNGEVEIYTDRHYGVTTILLRVPKSKKLGAKYYENEDLRNAIDKREFYQKSGKFQVAIPNGKLDEVLSVLSSLGVKVPSDVVKQLNESSQQSGNSRISTEDLANSELDETKFRLREEPAPKKTGIGYKVFVLKNGKLYPPMVANPNGVDTPVGVWLDADAAPVSGTSKTGRPQVKAGGKGTQGGSGQLAYRPGWHLGTIPYALQFNRKNPETGERELFPNNFVWAEVEYANDVDYQEEANKEGVNERGKYQHSLAGLKKLPKNGSYMYRTNPDPRTDPWIITGAMKVNKILTPSEVDNLVREAGREPQPRQEGAVTDEQINNLNKELEKHLNTRGRKGNGNAKPSEELQLKMREKTKSLAKSLNVQVEITTSDKLSGTEATAKGFYNPRTGKVVIVLDNNSSTLDIEQTVVHEIIGHKGLRGLLGKQNYYKIMNAVYDNLPQDEKDKINEAARRNGWQMYTAIDEYLADQAENMVWDAKSASLWQNVKHYLAEALRTLGFIIKPNLKDARYWLWLSKNQLKRSDAMSSIERNALLAKLDKLGLPEQKVEEQDHLGEPKYAFRNGNYVDSATYDAIEQNLKNNSFYWKEAFIDYMQAYQVFQNEMAKGLKNGLMDNQNALIGENALTSAIEQQQSDYMRMQLKPLQDIIKKLQPEFGEGEEGIRSIENYLMMKHGLERNRVLFMRDWFTAEASRKIENDGQLTPEGQLIYTSMYQSIWYEYTNGNIDEAERDKQLKIALNEAHLQYLNDVMSDFNSVKNIELQAYDWGIRSLAEAYKNIDDFINQHANFEADKQDKSGLTALKEYFSGNNYEDAAIIDQVQSYDDMIGSDMADKLMEAVQAVSQFALDEDYKNGLVTKEGYNRAKNMFRYYIPLRGFDETTMEDVYEYMTYSKGTGAKSLVHAKGRSSKAGSPLATAANMALNAIARGLRNQNKQRAYRLVNTWLKDNPTSVPPAIVTDLWVGLDANGNDTVFTPDVTDDMTAEEIRDEIEKFKDKMRIMEELGKASKVRSEASFRHRFSSDNHKYEHIVPLMINGKAKMIVFNGNPRPAQALRGDLAPTVNKEFGLDKIMGKLNRVMAGAFTSYNPTFMATNLLRDTGFANNNIAVKEGGKYYFKFLKNQAALLTKNIGKYAKLKWDYDKGIAPRNEMEQYFYEFMKNGGKTGFVNQQDIAKLEKLLAENNQNFSALNAGTVIAKYTVNAIKAANDRIENINRFAVYMTSRQMGRSVMRSIYDAKEVSVNFNRKGAAGNTGRTPNATASMKLAANLASFTRGAYLFFNAGVQSLNLLSKNTKGHPIKSAAYIVGIPLLLGGFVFPMLNQIIAEAAGDGDDDPYANLPEWTRRNNICIYLTHGVFLKIPLPIELRAFYGLGDIAAGYLVNEHLKSDKNVALDVASQLTQILPVDFLGEGGSVTAALTPDAMKPMIQIATNTDWTGKPIYKDSEWNKYEPEYTKAFKNEFEPFINLSKFINEAAGGSDHVRSDIEGEWNNPAIWHAIIQGYGGGAVMDVVRVGSLSRRLATMDSKGLTTKEVPIVKAIFETPSEKTQYYRMLNKFYSYQEKNEKFKHDLKVLSESASPLDHAKFLRHTDQNKPSREMIIWSRFRDYDKVNKYINKVLENPNLSEADREALEQQAVRLKVDLVKILDQIED